jgi:NADH-dependent peroxiredoxin subunit F
MQENTDKIFELIIIGGGPAGAAAAVYAGRKQLDTLIIKKEWGGQSVVSPDIHNWIGTQSISGEKLANDLKSHVENFKSEILKIENEEVTLVAKNSQNIFVVTCKSGKIFNSKTILITSGSNRRTLDVLGASELEHKGLTYCASCDGLFFAGLDVVVVGAGNSAFESALQLLAYCKSVTILVRSQNIKADPLTVEAVKKDVKAKIILDATPVKVLGTNKVEGIVYKDVSDAENTLSVSGIFVEIGQIPNTNFAKDLVKIDEIGKIEIDPWTQKTSESGAWAAGDCTNIKYHQNNIAAGDGIKALEDIYQFIKSSN